MNVAAEQPSSRRFSIAQLVLIIPWVAIVIDAWAPIGDNSFLWHIRAGSIQLANAEVLTSDPFSFTVFGERWLTQSWLGELFYAQAESVSGLGFVPWMLLCLTLVTFVGIGLVAYHYSNSVSATALVLLLSTILLISFLVPRPVIFSFALFPLVVLAWARPSARWALPFLMWIWASMHGSFVVGLAYLGIVLIVERAWRWLPAVVVSGVVTLATAHGLALVEIFLSFQEAGDALRLLVEWRRPDLGSPVFLSFLVGIALIVAGAYRRLIEPRHLFLLVPFVLIGLGAMRAIPPAWLAILPLVALSLKDMRVGGAPRFGAVPAAVFALVVAVFPFFLRSDSQLDEERLPVEAATALTEDRVFHDDRTGGYLIFEQWPERRVYLDDRAELYLERIEEFVEVRDGSIDWQPVFARDGIEQVLLHEDEDLVDELKVAGWSVTYSDGTFVVLTTD